MTSKARPVKKVPKPAHRPNVAPWAALGVVVVALVLLASVGPQRLLALLSKRNAPQAGGPVSLTILHTNDTWGYVFPCG